MSAGNAVPGGGGGRGTWARFEQERLDRMAARTENLTFVKGSRDPNDLDPVSAAILEVGSTGTSIFDPVLCEIAYRWFCPPGGAVLDPFTGGSVRGIVASKLGRRYTGIDLRAEQIDANRAQAEQICGDPMPSWVCGDSREVIPALARQGMNAQFDFVFSCPPYADLEVYSNDPRDLSTLDYDEFRAAYDQIIAGACALLKPDRFACFVVGDVRDAKGFYRNFPGHTIGAFEDAGLRLYNEAILVTAVGSLPIRAGKQFEASRKLGKTHQQVYVFCKGDPRRATEACGPVEFGEIEAEGAMPT
jgi:DNA modification methylase